MKKILITGADGFIGSHLTELLVKQGYNVRAFVFYNSFNSNGWLDTLSNEIKDKIEFFPIAVLGLLPAAGSSSSLAGATLDAGAAAAATTGNSIPHPSQNLFSPGTKPVPHILHFI